MRLLFVARRYPPDVRSGTETVFENLYARARERHELRLVVGYRRARELVPAEAVAVDLRRGSRPERYARLALAAAREVLRFRPDAVLSNSIEVPVLAPTACIVHDLNFGRAGESAGTRARRLYYRWKARWLGRVITVSEAMREQLARAGLPRHKLVAIRNGVDLRRFRPPDGPRPQRERWLLSYPSRILPGKGQHLLLEALALLAPGERDRLELRIVGTVADPAYLERLKDLARGLPVTFHLEVPDIAPYYREADLVLFPTLMEEGFGFTAVEALACERPVIASEQPAIREATGGHALFVREPTPAAWAAALRDFLARPAEHAERARAGREHVARHYDWDRVWLRYEQVLAELARGR